MCEASRIMRSLHGSCAVAAARRKTGAPISAVRMPTGTSAGAAKVRAAVSAMTSRIAPAQRRCGDESAVVLADRHAHEVGHDQADESNDAGQTDHHSGGDGHSGDQTTLKARNIDTQVSRGTLSDQGRVHLRGEQAKCEKGRQQNGHNHLDFAPVSSPEAAHEPEDDIGQLLAGEIQRPGREC